MGEIRWFDESRNPGGSARALLDSVCGAICTACDGPWEGADDDCAIGVSDTMYDPSIAELAVGVMFTAMWTSGTPAVFGFFDGGWS